MCRIFRLVVKWNEKENNSSNNNAQSRSIRCNQYIAPSTKTINERGKIDRWFDSSKEYQVKCTNQKNSVNAMEWPATANSIYTKCLKAIACLRCKIDRNWVGDHQKFFYTQCQCTELIVAGHQCSGGSLLLFLFLVSHWFSHKIKNPWKKKYKPNCLHWDCVMIWNHLKCCCLFFMLIEKNFQVSSLNSIR